jgi:hypothetical protein
LIGLTSLPAPRSNPEAEQSAFAAAYREGLGLACIALHRAAAGIVISAAGQGDAAVDGNGTEFAARWWCRRAADAMRIAAAARAKMRRREANAVPQPATAAGALGKFDSQRLSLACADVEDTARRHGVALFSDDEIAAHAAEITARIDAELEKLKESGGMKSVNQAYKAYRLQSSGRGERVLRYDEWMRRYRADLVRQAAAALREL